MQNYVENKSIGAADINCLHECKMCKQIRIEGEGKYKHCCQECKIV